MLDKDQAMFIFRFLKFFKNSHPWNEPNYLCMDRNN